MTLATVAYRISTDASFASLLQKSPEEALRRSGIALSAEEKTALQKFMEIPGQLASRIQPMFVTGEPWAIEM